MAISVANLLHRTIVFGCLGFGVYGSVVIAQNFIVKRQRLKEYDAGQRAAAEMAAADGAPPPVGFTKA